MEQNVSSWASKIRRFSIRGRMYWFRTDDGGFSWKRISAATAMQIIDSLPGIVLKENGK